MSTELERAGDARHLGLGRLAGGGRRRSASRRPPFLTVVTSPDSDLILISSILSVSRPAKTFSCFVPAGVVRFGVDEVDVGAESGQDDDERERRLEAAHASRASAARSRCRCRRSSDGNAEHRDPVDVGLLRRRQRQAAIVGFLGPDRDEVLLLRQPADRVQEEILVALECPSVPLDAKSESPNTTTRVSGFGAFGLLGLGGIAGGARERHGGRQRDRALLVALRGVDLDLARGHQRLEVGFRPASRARLDERLRRVTVDAARSPA